MRLPCARLAFEIGAEIDGLVAGLFRELHRGVERLLGPRDQFERRAREGGIIRLAALVVGIVERAAHGIVDIELVPGHDRARIGQRGRIGHGGAGGDRGGIVMRHVGDRERHDLGGVPAGARQTSALDPRQMLAHDVHLADRRARTQERPVDRLLLRKADAVHRRDPVR
jgi:hypothetical protein